MLTRASPDTPTHTHTNAPRTTRILLVLWIILSLACALPAFGRATPSPLPPSATPTTSPTPTNTPMPQPLPPALVESVPPLGVELPLAGPLTLYFNQAMQRTSVEAALSGTQNFRLTWSDDRTLALYPDGSWSPDADLTVNLETGASSVQGLTLTQPIHLEYRTAGYLRPAQSLPEPGSLGVDPSSAVVAAFNRPVVPLGGDPASFPAAFKLLPEAQGRGEWLNTSTYVFYPEPPLVGGVRYTVNLNPDLKSSGGSPLQPQASTGAQAWDFTTALPRLVSIQPSPEAPWPLDAEIALIFNQPMDAASTQANFALRGQDGEAVQGAITWNEDFTQMSFTPAENLARNTPYVVHLDGQAQARGGSLLGDSIDASVITVPPLTVFRTEPEQGGSLDPQKILVLHFTTPLAKGDLRPYLSLSPQVPNLSAWWTELEKSHGQLSVRGDFSPNTAYTLTVSANLADIWDGTLGQDFVLNFVTTSLRPNLVILAGEAIFAPTQESSIVAQATNLFELPLSVGSLSLEDFFALSGPDGYELRQSFQSQDQRSWRQALDIDPDRTQAADIYLSENRNPLSPGLYLLRINLDQPHIYAGPYLVVASDVQVTYKVGATDALVWAVHLRNGALLPDLPVTLYDENGTVLDAGFTDTQGVFRASFPAREDPYSLSYAVVGQPGQATFGMALSSWSQQGYQGGESLRIDPRPPELHAYLYTDRPIYRPGHTVYFRAIVRQAFNGRYTLPDLASLPLSIYDDQGQEIASFDLPLTAFGSAHGEYPLPESAQPGNYWISSPDISTANLSFQVANYRKPEINLQVQFASQQAQAGEALRADIDAHYFFGAPAGNLDLHWALYAAPSYFHLPGYHVGLEETDWLVAYQYPNFADPLGELIEEGEAQTQPDGSLSLELPTQAADARQLYTLEITATDESGLPVSARASLEVNPARIYIGVRPDAWFGRAGEALGFEIQVVDWDKAPAGVQELRAEFSQVTWERQDPPLGDPSGQPSFTRQESLVASTDFTTSDNGQARLSFTPATPGTYLLHILSPGTSPMARTELVLWVGGPGTVTWPNLPNARLRLTADQDNYQASETAQVFIPNPFGRDIQALVTVERGLILKHQVLNIGPEGYNLELPLNADFAPNVYLSVTLLGLDRQGRLDFRQGFLNLAVEPTQQTLHVSLLSQPQRASPGEEVTFDILVSDASGNPVQGEFSLSVVDLAVLALADPNAPPITTDFYGEQPLGLNTALSLGASTQRPFYYPLGVGGGGGAPIPSVVRERFPDTAYWNAEIVTGADGRAQVSLALPDSLTTWQVDVRGLTIDSRVGEASIQIVVSKDVLIRPVTPRFLVAGDHLQLAAIAQNNTTSDLQASVSLQGNGFSLDDPSTQTQQVHLAPGGRARVEWWGSVQDAPQADLIFSIQGQDSANKTYQDATRPSQGNLPILRFLARQSYRSAGTLDEGGSVQELVSLPRSFTLLDGELDVELSPSLAAAMLTTLEALEHTPYESSEATLSRFLPNLETYRALQGLGIEDAPLKARLERALADGLLRLQSSQNYDGGWGWWAGGLSDEYLTSYVLFGLGRAQDAGVDISPDMIQRAVEYLQSNPNLVDVDPYPTLATWQLDRLAFAHFALLEIDTNLLPAGDSYSLDTLYQVKGRLSPWAQATLALALERASPGSGSQAQSLLSDLQTQAVRSATGAHWEIAQTPEGGLAAQRNMHTTASNSAIVVYALAQHDPTAPLLADAVRYLMGSRSSDGTWASSYTTTWALIALAQYMQGSGEPGGDFAFSAALNGLPLAQGQAGGVEPLTPVTAQVPLSGLYPDYPNLLLIQRQPGQGRLYYTAALQVSRPVDEVTPLSQGLNVARAWYPASEACQPGACAPLSGAQAGSKVSVRLSLNLPQDMYYLVVEDYIPAGAEILDTRLKTSQLGEDLGPGTQVTYDPRNPFAEGWGWWLFHEAQIYDDHITWAADYLPAGTYELTYTLVLLQPGLYQVLPARAWALYFPEIQANSGGDVFEVRP